MAPLQRYSFTQIHRNETEAVIVKIIPVTGFIMLLTLMPTSDLRLPQLTVIDRSQTMIRSCFINLSGILELEFLKR